MLKVIKTVKYLNFRVEDQNLSNILQGGAK
jgi:hypothetical protein